MDFEPIIVFFLVRLIRKNLKEASLFTEYDKYLRYAMFGVIGLYILSFPVRQELLVHWFWHLILLGVILVIYKRPELVRLRNLMFAVLPLVVVGLLRDLSGLFGTKSFRKVDEYLDYADPFVFVWMVAMFVIYTRQQKTIDKERKKRLEEEKLYQITSAQKAQLEVMVAERTSELTTQKEELQHALSNLKNTQTQLIQSEKMASLGELTAGIAHEIQNPLNFVNNFAEVNVELIDELTSAFSQGNKNEVLSIAGDIRQNLEKITHHGRRADAIVKGMLQHSKTNSGQKEPTDINQLADEYLGLSFHGLRAKDKNFNAALKKNFDPSIKPLNIIPQDIGRVLLNIYNNAFYAVSEKKKLKIAGYEPTVTVTTRKIPGKVEIRIRDNGQGIPDKVLDKIFQPFFTTKPTGQGTGLGLSLSFDIITKGHGGTMTVDTQIGEYSEFIIQLPA
jgi:two-component system NtrC family sensor kinase